MRFTNSLGRRGGESIPCAGASNRVVTPRTRLFVIWIACCAAACLGAGSPDPSEATRRGRAFLVSLLDTNLSLLPEYRGARVYWLFHDNYLASKVLSHSHPGVARAIASAMAREGIRKSGKIEILFGEAESPLPFRQYELTDVRAVGDKVLRTEIVRKELLSGWTNYADLLLMAALAESNQSAARSHRDAAMRMWDGHGFMDPATRHLRRYSTYKLGLALLVSRRVSPPIEPPAAVMTKLLEMQDHSGGWITDYDAAGKKIGVANVETTCLAILGLEAAYPP